MALQRDSIVWPAEITLRTHQPNYASIHSTEYEDS
jgi:hypothetical protein